MKEEEWRDVPGFKGHYQVSNLGEVRSFKSGSPRILKQTLCNHGYPMVCLCINSKCNVKRVHKLVASAFLNHKPCGFDKVIDHINENKEDNRLINLQVITTRENVSKSSKKKSGLPIGVFNCKNGRYKSQININQKNVWIGSYDTVKEASNAYQKKIKELKEL